MLKISRTESLIQVYTDNREELVKWLSEWAIKNDVFVDSRWIKHTDKNGFRQYYADFFGKYYNKVNEDELRKFTADELLSGLEKKIRKSHGL